MSSQEYVQPIACHRQFTERLVLRDTAGRTFVWFGDGREMIEMPGSTAEWILSRPEMSQLQSPLLWFDPSSLPLGTTTV